MPNVSLCAQENEVHYNPSSPVPDFQIVSIEPFLPIVIGSEGSLIITFNGDVYEHFVDLGEKLYLNGIENYVQGNILGWKFTDLPDSPVMETLADMGSTVLELYPPGVEIPVESVSLSPA